jgi:hypothetical protein
MGGLDEAIQSNPIGLDQEPLGLNDSMDRHRVRPDADSSELFETDGQDCFQVFGLGHFLDDLADTEEGGLLFVLALELLFFQRQFFDGPSPANTPKQSTNDPRAPKLFKRDRLACSGDSTVGSDPVERVVHKAG